MQDERTDAEELKQTYALKHNLVRHSRTNQSLYTLKFYLYFLKPS